MSLPCQAVMKLAGLAHRKYFLHEPAHSKVSMAQQDAQEEKYVNEWVNGSLKSSYEGTK